MSLYLLVAIRIAETVAGARSISHVIHVVGVAQKSIVILGRK